MLGLLGFLAGKDPTSGPSSTASGRLLLKYLSKLYPPQLKKAPMAPKARSQVSTHPSALEALGSHPVYGSGLLLAFRHQEPSVV